MTEKYGSIKNRTLLINFLVDIKAYCKADRIRLFFKPYSIE